VVSNGPASIRGRAAAPARRRHELGPGAVYPRRTRADFRVHAISRNPANTGITLASWRALAAPIRPGEGCPSNPQTARAAPYQGGRAGGSSARGETHLLRLPGEALAAYPYQQGILREIRRRTRVVGAFPALMSGRSNAGPYGSSRVPRARGALSRPKFSLGESNRDKHARLTREHALTVTPQGHPCAQPGATGGAL
jgi:hypothetical protein